MTGIGADGGRMIIAPIHVEEEARILALKRLAVLDTPAEERFDRITRLLSTVLSVPIALITFVDSDRQWFKSRVGLDVPETPREIAFCAHAINEPPEEPFIVEDTLCDDRFVDNPLVVNDPNVRFYAGQVLRDPSGLPLGTLCAMDRRPRQLNDEAKQALKDLAVLVEAELRRMDERVLRRELDEVSRRNSLILDTLAEGLVFHDAMGRIVTWNPAAERMLGLSGEELSGRTSFDPRWGSVHEDGTPWKGETHPAMAALRTAAPVRNQLMGIDHPVRGRVWLRVNAEPVVDPEGKAVSVLAAFSDVTIEHSLAVESRRFSYLFRHSNDVISVIDGQGHAIYHSPSFQRVFGYPPSWRDPAGLWGSLHPDDHQQTRVHLAKVMGPGGCERPFVVRFRTANGNWIALETVAVNLLDEPEVGGIVFTSRDVTERVRVAEELAYTASHDELTDLPNRRKLAQCITNALDLNRGRDQLVGLCFVDLDGFKSVNDTFGHATGDKLLVAVAQSIRAAIRPGDHAARVGGDEFVVVLSPVADTNDALHLACQLRDSIVARPVDGLPSDAFDACIGVAVSEPGDTHSLLLQRADRALYEAKSQRGCVHLALR